MQNIYQVLTSDIRAFPLNWCYDKPLLLGGLNFMPKKEVSKLCNKCGLFPKYPAQGLCKKCFFEKIHQQWVDSRPAKVPIPDLDGELWLDIIGANGYQISNHGRIKSLNYYEEQGRHAILKLREARKGSYLKVDLDKYKWRPSVHRLVALHFIVNPENKSFVNHQDGNKQNNHYSNLEWVTRSENVIHAYKVLKISHSKPNKGRFGGNHCCAKSIKQINISSLEIIKNWPSIADASRSLNIHAATISRCITGRSKTAGGYKWEYA